MSLEEEAAAAAAASRGAIFVLEGASLETAKVGKVCRRTLLAISAWQRERERDRRESERERESVKRKTESERQRRQKRRIRKRLAATGERTTRTTGLTKNQKNPPKKKNLKKPSPTSSSTATTTPPSSAGTAATRRPRGRTSRTRPCSLCSIPPWRKPERSRLCT